MADIPSQLTFGGSTSTDIPEMVEILTDCFTTFEASHGSLVKQRVHSINDFRNTFSELVEKACGNEYTVVAKDGCKLVGVQLAWSTTLEDYLNAPAMRHIPQVSVFLGKCHEKRTEDLPGEKFIYISYCGVREEYRNKGIGSKMTQLLVEKVKSEKCWPAVFVECTGLYSQRAMAKQGFKVIAEMKYEDYTNEEGELILKHTQPHPSAQLMLLKLR